MANLDPTKTSTLRLQYAREMNKRFRALSADVRESFIDNGALTVNAAARRGQFDFPERADKIEAFKSWLQRQIDDNILEIAIPRARRIELRQHWQDSFLRTAYVRAVRDTERTLDRARALVSPVGEISSIFTTGVHGETLRLMFTRAFEGLRGITEAMSSQLSVIFSDALIEGIGPRVIAKRITDSIGAITRRRALVLARTETIRVYNEAKLNILEQNGIGEVQAQVEFLTAQDDRVCPICSALSGKIYTLSAARGVIPVHPKCLPGDTLITSSPRISAVFKRWYDGDLIIIYTANGKQLSCTPNHPILTDSGFIGASRLNIGGQVISGSVNDREMGGVDHADNIKSSIEDIAESFFSSSKVIVMEMPMSSENFYGDSSGSDVYIVGADIELLDNTESSLSQHIRQDIFKRRDARLFLESTLSNPTLLSESYFSSSCGLISCPSLMGSLVWASLSPLDFLRIALASDSDVVIDQSFPNNVPGYIPSFSNSIFGPSSLVEFNNIISRNLDRPRVTNLDILFSESSQNGIHRDPQFFSQMFGWDSQSILLDEIIHIDIQNFRGHVYDLQTYGGYFFANSIAVSNCRCTWIPVI